MIITNNQAIVTNRTETLVSISLTEEAIPQIQNNEVLPATDLPSLNNTFLDVTLKEIISISEESTNRKPKTKNFTRIIEDLTKKKDKTLLRPNFITITNWTEQVTEIIF